MKIYEFTTWCANNYMFTIKEIEVAEKPKTYIGNHARINKDDIDKLQNGYGDRMFRLDRNPKPYIEAMIEKKRLDMERATEKLNQATKDYDKWFDLKKW